jgi:hypothetical protein
VSNADTDGDGIPDGRDPAPLAPPATTDAGRAAEEILRYLGLFRMGGPVSVYADRELWAGASASVGLVLHHPRRWKNLPGGACETSDFCEGDRAARHGLPGQPTTPILCESMLAIESVVVNRDRAEAIVAWPPENGGGARIGHALTLRKHRLTWRVVDDQPDPPRR